MRLFVALNPSDEALDHLVAAVEPLRAAETGLRWAPRERLHLTLTFLGEVDARRLPGLGGRLARAAAACAPLRLHLCGGGRFGDSVLFCRVRGDVAGLVGLADACGAAGRHTGIDVGSRPFEPHLTIARSRRSTGHHGLRPLVDQLADYEGPWWLGESIQLVQSHLGPRPRHEVVEQWWLGPPAGGGRARR
jgi:2'-5' RNA ligase